MKSTIIDILCRRSEEKIMIGVVIRDDRIAMMASTRWCWSPFLSDTEHVLMFCGIRREVQNILSTDMSGYIVGTQCSSDWSPSPVT